MTDERQRAQDSPSEGAPTWLRILEAAIIGIVAGFALNALLSMVVLQGEGVEPTPPSSQCRKANPAGEAGTTGSDTPRISGVTWTVEGLQANGWRYDRSVPGSGDAP